MSRYRLETMADQLLDILREQPFEEPVSDDTVGLAEELAEAVLEFFREADWAETLAELARRRVTSPV